MADQEGIEVLPPTVEDMSDQLFALPFQVHSSHRLLHCAGFTACEACATMASTGTKANKQMAMACPGKDARTTGTMCRLRKLQSGFHPRPERSNGQWPNGEPWHRSHPPHPVHRIRIRRSTETRGKLYRQHYLRG